MFVRSDQVSIVSSPEHRSEISSNETSHYQSTSNWVEEVMQCVPTNMVVLNHPQKYINLILINFCYC